MIEALRRLPEGGDGEIHARIVEHPLRVIFFHHRRLDAEHGRVEFHRLGNFLDRDVDMHPFHAFTFPLSAVRRRCLTLVVRARLAGCRRALFRVAPAAVFHQVGDQIVHRDVVGAVDDRAAVAPAPHQPRVFQVIQMEREGRRRNAELGADFAGGHSVGAALHQHPEHVEPRFLGEGGERGDCFLFLHIFITIEISKYGQGRSYKTFQCGGVLPMMLAR